MFIQAESQTGGSRPQCALPLELKEIDLFPALSRGAGDTETLLHIKRHGEHLKEDLVLGSVAASTTTSHGGGGAASLTEERTSGQWRQRANIEGSRGRDNKREKGVLTIRAKTSCDVTITSGYMANYEGGEG